MQVAVRDANNVIASSVELCERIIQLRPATLAGLGVLALGDGGNVRHGRHVGPRAQ
jgi:hypothetical protein